MLRKIINWIFDYFFEKISYVTFWCFLIKKRVLNGKDSEKDLLWFIVMDKIKIYNPFWIKSAATELLKYDDIPDIALVQIIRIFDELEEYEKAFLAWKRFLKRNPSCNDIRFVLRL